MVSEKSAVHFAPSARAFADPLQLMDHLVQHGRAYIPFRFVASRVESDNVPIVAAKMPQSAIFWQK
jgi:hypothetical protein